MTQAVFDIYIAFSNSSSSSREVLTYFLQIQQLDYTANQFINNSKIPRQNDVTCHAS